MPINLQPSTATATATAGIIKKERTRGEGSRRMPNNSRPPLSHRIRASFEGKKSQDSTSPKHASFSGSSPTDPEVLRQAIDYAISGDAFQAGIASHIAKMLKPQIKTALDTIEPLVNAVLQHEILLKKTNASVENVLLRLDTMTDEDGAVDPTKARLSTPGALSSHPISERKLEDATLPISSTSTPDIPGSAASEQPIPLLNRNVTYTVGKLSEISDSLDLNNNKLGKVVEGIAQLNDLLLSNERLDSLKESSEKNATNTSVMQAQLDQLQENVRVIITRIGSDLGTNVKAINDRLAEGIPGSEKAVVAPGSNEEDAQLLRAISSELEVLKGNLDAGTSSHNENLASLKMQISALQSTLDDQKVLLGEIKEADNSVDILAGIQKSNESHEAHTAILGELKERNAEPVDASTQPIPASGDAETLQTILAEVQKSNEAHEKHEAALAGIKDSETSAAILAEVQKSNESHTSHAAALETLKSSPTPPPEPTTSIDLEGLETKMGSLIETSTSILAEVQKSNESHVSHAAALESIKALPTPPPESTPASASVDLEGLEKNMGSIIEKLDNHAAVLDEIKTKELSVSGGIDSTAFDGHFGSINTLLDAHTAALDELKAKDSPIADFGPIILLLESHTAILDEIKAKDLPITDLTPITSMLESHTAALDELKARDLPITDFAPVTSILESHNAILDEIKAKDLPITDLAPITSMLEAHTATLDEIKAKDGASNIDFGPITSILESHSAVLDEIKTKDGASNIDFNPITSILESHTSALEELKSKDIPTADFTPVTSLLEAHSAILEDIKAKDVAPAIDFGPITSTLESHSAALDEIKSKDVQSSAEPASINMEAFDTHFGAITGMLAAHTAALDEIKSKDNSSDSSVPVEINTEALDKHFGSITSMLEAHTATLDEMKSKDVTASTGPTEFNTAVFDGHFNSLTSLLESHTAALDEIKSKNNDFSQPSTEARNCTGFEVFEPHITAMKSALDAQMVVLDGLKSEALAKNDMDATVVDNMLEPHILAIKSTLDGHTAILEELKSKIYSDNASPPETTNDSLPTILQTLSSHTNLLTEIKNADVSDEILTALHELQESNSTAFNTLKESDVSDEILTALHTCNDSQEKLDKSLLELQTTLNTSSLSEQSGEESIQPIEEIPGPASGVNINGLETQISAVIATLEGQSVVLEEIKNAANGGMEAHSLHTTTLSEIKDAANASNESHNTHTATLEVIRDATAALSNAHSTQVNMLNELKEALNTSNESHNTHASTLGEIRDATASSNEAHTSHTSTLAELKEAINSSVESHASHTAALADLKSLQSAQPSPDTIVDTKSAPILDTSGLDTQLTTIITALESQTSTLGEIKEVHTSHTTILDEIKDATIASNESHISHTTILSEIKELTAPVHGINEVLSTHTSFLEGLKDGSGSKHDEVRGDIESLKKIIEESSGKHEENLLKHGELIKEHGELVKENHDGLKGTIAGLAIGGIVGAGVIKAVGGNEEGTPSSVDKEVPEETIETGPETQTEEKEVPVEELTPVENEAPVEEESASDTKEMEPEALAEEEETPVIEESSIAPEDIEAPQEPEVSVEEEKAIEEEKPVDEVDIEQDPEPEVMPTEPDVVAEPKEEVSTPDPVENEPASEPEAVVEEAPVEELASSEPEKPVEEAVTEDSTPKEEEKDAEPPTIETDETPSVEPQEAEGGGAAEETISQDRSVSVEPDVPSEPEPNPEDNAPASNAEPVVAETSEDTEIPTEEIVEEPTPVQATNPEEDLQIVEESEVNEKVEDSTPEIVEEPISNQDTTDMEETPVPEEEATPGEDNVPESSNDQPEPEESAVTEEVPVEKEVAEDEGPKEETDGESKEDKVHGDGEIVDGDEPKSAEEAAPVVVEEENPIEEIIQDTEEKELRLNDEENSTEEAVPEVLIENPAVTSEETLPLETDEAPAASEEAKVPNSDENSLESEENTILPDQADSVISEPSHSVSTEHVDSATEHKVTESISEDPQVCVEADSEKPIEIEEKSLETGTKDPSDEDISSDAIENPIEPLQKEDIPEPNVESETSIPELSDPSQLPEESKDKDLDNEEELNEPLHNENIPEQIVETAVPVSLLADQEQTPTECEGNSQIGENSNEDVSNETAESVIEPSTEDTPPETVAETETSPELNNQDQTPIESEEKSLEPPQVNEYDTDKIPKIIDEKSIETLEEEVSTEPTIETESPISSELKDEENSIKDEISEPAVLGLESSEQHPSADSEDKSKSLEMQIEEPSNDTQPSKSEENTVEPHEENSPEPPIKTETPVFASDDQEQPPVKNEESTLDLELNTPIVQELEVSEEQPSWSTNSEEQITDITPQEIMQVSVVEDESSTSVPESTEEILSTVKDEELPELTDERAIDISNDEPSTESKPSNPLEEDHIVIIKPENITAELDDKNENPTEIPESIDEDQVIIDDKEKPTSANEELTETPIEEKVGSESLAPKPDIGEDPEDVKAREEIAILNAEMANILADEEIKSSEPMAEDATKSEGDNCIVEAETISGDEPKALEVEQIIEKPIDVTDEQTPVENPETLEEQHEDEPIYTEVIELKEEQADSVIGDELSSELEVKESLEEPPLRSITSEETSQEEPEAAVFESSIPKPTENPLSQEEITPIITEEVAESHAQVSENEILPEEKSEELFAELQESLDSILQETAGHTAMKDLSNESAFSQAEDLPEEEIQVKEAAPLPLESSVETEGNEDLHLRLEAAMDTEPQASEDKTIPEEPTMECESKVPERKRTDSPIQKVSGIESELTVESPELVEVANQESDNGISPLEHIEDFEADSGPQDHVSDTDSVVINDSRAVEGEIVIENYSNPKELEIESMTESIFNEISSSGLVANNNAVEGSVRELENAEDIRLPELSHEEIPVIGELQWGSKPVHDDVDSEILLPSDLDQDEPVQFEEETGFISAQDSIQARSYQASEDIPSDREFLRKYSIIQNEDGIEHMSYSSSRDVPVLSENEFVRGRNMSGEPESVFDTKEVVNEEISENTPWDRIYQGHVESQIFPESQPQTQPIREYIPVVPESSQIYKTSVPTKGEPSIDRESSFMVSRNERVIGDSQDVSEDIPVGMNDEFMFGDNASVYSQEFVPEDYRKEQESPTLDRSFKPTTSASEYVSSERLERESESEPTRFYSREPYLHHENKSFEPEASSNRKYSTFAETRLDTRSSFNYQDDDEQFNLEQENTQFNSREFYPAHKTDLSKPASPLEQRYSSYEEFPPEIRSTLNYQDDEQSDPEPETRHTDTSYSYDQFSKSFSSEETQVNNYEPEPEHPVTPTDQMTYEDNIPPTPPTALSRQISTERFPAYDESRRSPISHGFNLGLPIRNPERVETIPESPQFEHENRYPMYNQPLRSSGPSRLPMPSTRSIDNMREIPDFDDERPYPKYDNPARSSRSPQPLDFGLSRRIPVPADTTRQSSAFDNEPTYPGCEELGHPSRSSQGFNFGVSARNIAPVDYQREAREWVHERGKVKNLLRQFEGGESVADAPVPPPHERISTASPYDRLGTAIPQPQDHFGTAIPRPLDTRSFGKQPAYEEESRVAVPFDRRSEFRGGESSMGQRSLQGEFGLGRGEGSSFASPSGWEFGLGGEGRRGDEDGGDRAGYGGGYEYGYGDSSGVSKKGKSKKEKEKRRSGGGGNMY